MEIVSEREWGLYRLAAARLIVPVIAREGEQAEAVNAQTVRIVKAKGTLSLRHGCSRGLRRRIQGRTSIWFRASRLFRSRWQWWWEKGAQIWLEAI